MTDYSQLLEHGVLGVVIALQTGFIYYLLKRIEVLTDKLTVIHEKQEAFEIKLDTRI